MKTSDHINKYRISNHPIPMFQTTDADGMNGCFAIPLDKESRNIALVIASDGRMAREEGVDIPWEHVSVRIGEKHNGKRIDRVPDWNEMCLIKDLFFKPEECVVQFHPPRSEYVNTHPCVLHLWRWKGGEFPAPPKICV